MLALINGNFRFRRPGAAPRPGGGFFPLGLLSLQAYLGHETNWEAGVLDAPPLEARPGEEVAAVARWLDGVEAQILGFSVTALSLPLVLAALRRRGESRPVILGGPGVQGLPPSFLDDFPAVEAVVYGEGERALLAALRRLGGEDVPIPGASYREGGEVVHRPHSERLASLDLIPPVCYDGLLPAAGPRRIVTESSRGCPFRCTFCSSPGVWDNRVTYRSPRRIVADLRRCADELGPLQGIFVDDLFTLSRKRVLALCADLEAAALPLRWVCFGRVETVDEEVLEAMARAGCMAVSFGVEAGSDRVLERLGKGFTARRARQVITRAAGILPMVEASFIRGFPFETLEEFRRTLDLMEAVHGAGGHAKLYTLTPLPGTALSREFASRWRFTRDYANPSLPEWFPVPEEMLALFDEHPYLAWPYGFFDDPEREAKEALQPPWAEAEHRFAAPRTRTTAQPTPAEKAAEASAA